MRARAAPALFLLALLWCCRTDGGASGDEAGGGSPDAAAERPADPAPGARPMEPGAAAELGAVASPRGTPFEREYLSLSLAPEVAIARGLPPHDAARARILDDARSSPQRARMHRLYAAFSSHAARQRPVAPALDALSLELLAIDAERSDPVLRGGQGEPEPEDRAAALLARMTLEEKVAQLGSAFHHQVIREVGGEPRFTGDADALLRHGLGSISRIAAWPGRSPETAARLVEAVQRRLIEETRLGIPALVHEEALSGFAARGATVYPQALVLAATFDPGAAFAIADRIRAEMLATGVRQALAPVCDVALDPRWGRTEETFGEDPLLAAAMAAAFVRGLQGADLQDGVAATLKHFAGHGVPEGGRNAAPVHIGPRALRETFLPPFQAGIAAGARSVMCAYHDRDGLPAAADRVLLTTLLRDRMGFRGVVVSDYGSVGRLFEVHRVASNPLHAGVLALRAGIDVELPQVQCFGRHLVDAVRSGAVSVADLDAAVLRVLRLKSDLGLFDDPRPRGALPGGFDPPSERERALRVARSGMVLLANDGVLPLDRGARIALSGVAAASPLALAGDYSYPVAIDDSEGGVEIPSILDALSERFEVEYTPAGGLFGHGDGSVAAARESARSAGIALVVLGDREGRARTLSGEHRDRQSLALTPPQRELLDAVLESGARVVLVLATGRPVAEPDRFERCAAVMWVGHPGEAGAAALADLLEGRVSPSGRLPISWPRSAGQIPVHYRRHGTSLGPYAGEADPEEQVSSDPLFPFGHGLGYARILYRDLVVRPTRPATDGTIEVSCVVENRGVVPAQEVVQIYARDEIASTVRPRLELVGFARVALPPGGASRVRFSLSVDRLALVDPTLRRVVEPGWFEFFAGPSSSDLPLGERVEVAGRPRVVDPERFSPPDVAVEPLK